MYIYHSCGAGDTGLEIAPGKDVDENPDLKEIGNIWNAVPTAKHWTPIDPIEGCITVNIGDGLQWWTDGLFKSTYHRVRAPKDGDNKVNSSQLSTRYDRMVVGMLVCVPKPKHTCSDLPHSDHACILQLHHKQQWDSDSHPSMTDTHAG